MTHLHKLLPFVLACTVTGCASHKPNPGGAWYLVADAAAKTHLHVSQIDYKEFADRPDDVASYLPFEGKLKKSLKEGHVLCTSDFAMPGISLDSFDEKREISIELEKAREKWPSEFGSNKSPVSQKDPGFGELQTSKRLYLTGNIVPAVNHDVAALNQIAKTGLNAEKYNSALEYFYVDDLRHELSELVIFQHRREVVAPYVKLLEAKRAADAKVLGENSDAVIEDLEQLSDTERVGENVSLAFSFADQAFEASKKNNSISSEEKKRLHKFRDDAYSKLPHVH